MQKGRKVLIFILCLALLTGGLWLYWEGRLPMEKLLPEENWVTVKMAFGIGGEGETNFREVPLEPVLAAIGDTTVTRGPKDNLLGGDYIHLMLHKGKPYPTVITVESNGQVSIAPEMDFDNWQNYEHGEELYESLLGILQEKEK